MHFLGKIKNKMMGRNKKSKNGKEKRITVKSQTRAIWLHRLESIRLHGCTHA